MAASHSFQHNCRKSPFLVTLICLSQSVFFIVFILSVCHVNVSGVYLCKHADILQPFAFHNGQTGYLIVFKILKVSLCMFTSCPS